MKNKITLITGGSHGLGRNMLLSLAKNGIDIIISYNNQEDEAKKLWGRLKLMEGRPPLFN